jgi:CheY-like chemotaxis protein
MPRTHSRESRLILGVSALSASKVRPAGAVASAVLVHLPQLDRRYPRAMPRRLVLIADDSAVARVSVARRVRAAGIDVLEEESAAGASAVDATGLSCALLDLELGDGDGTEVAERLRARQGALPIAFFTSTRTPEILARASTFGPVFAKPDQLDDAVDWIQRHGA